MSFGPRPTSMGGSHHLRQSSLALQGSSQSSALQTRIDAKRSELENLRQLRDLSGALAGQMQALEDRLGTLRDGTESVAHVLANWENILRAISMASMKLPITKDREERVESEEASKDQDDVPLPVTIVRIPAEQRKSSKKERDNDNVERDLDAHERV